MKSEIERFPRLFRAVESIPGLTWPNVVFDQSLTLFLGSLEVQILHLGRGHTKGDTVVWLPREKVLFSGDLVEFAATPYTGDAYLQDWPATLDRIAALGPAKLVPGRGEALQTPEQVAQGLADTRAFITSMFESVRAGQQGGRPGVAPQHQDARRVEIEAMDQARPFAIGPGERAQHRVEIAPLAGTALDREPGRLVEDQDIVVLMDHQAAHEAGIDVRNRRGPAARRDIGVDVGRQTDDLSGDDAGLALRALAVEADLALAEQLFDPSLCQAGKTPPQPAIEPLVGILGLHFDQAGARHRSSLRPGDVRMHRALKRRPA